jgi:N-acetylneuraminic acid mutarotase
MVRDTTEQFLVHVVTGRRAGELELTTVSWPKRSFEEWWHGRRVELRKPLARLALGHVFRLPSIAMSGCTDDTWEPSPGLNASLPSARWATGVVWTGSEMIVWGGTDDGGAGVASGGRYNPATDTWAAISALAAPGARFQHTAVWTGSEMVVWGGRSSGALATGGRYNPVTDSWAATNAGSAPAARYMHSAVWTGTEMILWGGFGSNFLATGGRYSPSSDSWVATSDVGAPIARHSQVAVWTGTELVVWGGLGNSGPVNSGGRFNPAAGTWTATSAVAAPAARYAHSAVWTGTAMVVWGGFGGSGQLNTGARYSPTTDTWVATSLVAAPSARSSAAAVWTGQVMLIWGGFDGTFTNSGARYDPTSDSWLPISALSAPAGRSQPAAVWTGSELLLWGGTASGSALDTGGRYRLSTDTWVATSQASAPSARYNHTATWTGTEMLVWGGDGTPGSSFLDTGSRYTPSTDIWSPISPTAAPAGRREHTAVWTGTEMVVWGGVGAGFLSTGGRYNPAANTWTGTNPTSAPSGRQLHTAVWTGTEMVVWGGQGGGGAFFDTGGRYSPTANSWVATSIASAPSARREHTAVWTGTQMIVWGGYDNSYLDSGGRYDPAADSWVAISLPSSPAARRAHTAVWTGVQMVAWGGYNSLGTSIDTGGRYDPNTDGWLTTSTLSAPSARGTHTAVWTGSEMLVWGGGSDTTGGRYHPASNSWATTSLAFAPTARGSHTAVWTGSVMAVWGGLAGTTSYNSGGLYCATEPADVTPPTNATFSSASPPASVWSNDNTVAVSWSGAADEVGGSGLAGYSFAWDTSAASTPDATVDLSHISDPHSTTSSALADGNGHYFHLRTCDVAGNCSSTLHAGPFWIDTLAPSVPGSLAATSHAVGIPSPDGTIDIAWTVATDATAGVDGYSVFFDGAAGSPCETAKDVEEAILAATSPTLAAGTWYAHVCAVDNAGNWGAERHAGPFVVDPTAPPGDMVLYYTDYGLDVIRRIRVDGLGEVTVRSEPEPFGLALDPGLAHLYWMSRSPTALRRSATDGTGATGLVGTGMVAPYGVALDLAAGKVYWSDPSGGTVRRANLDGSGEASFLSGLSVPVGIAIDTVGRRLYVAELGAGQISSAPLAGGAATLFRSGAPAVHDLAIDPSQRRLFWSESAVNGRIGRVDLDGSGAIDVKANEAFPGGLVVDSAHGYVYWVQEIGGTIRRARTDGGGLLTIRSGLTSPSGLVLDQGDVTPPTSPSVAALAPHVQGGWASASTIAMQWSGASDEAGGSGIAGYSVLFDANALTEPDATIEVAHGSDPRSTTSPSLADGEWYFHLRTCDVAGNCTPAIHSGPYGVDTTAPTGLVVMSPSHPISGWSSDATVDFTISGAADANGLTGYSIVFDQSPATVPDAVTELAGTTFTGTASPDGFDWWLHVRACDTAGNCGVTVHAGPYFVDTTAPTSPAPVTSASHGSGSPVADATIDVAWGAAADVTSGVAGYRFGFDTTATTSDCLDLGATTAATSATSGALADGAWYVHVCALDQAGNAGAVTHGGPYVVDTAQTAVVLYWGSFAPPNLGRGLLGGTGSILLATPEVASPLGVDVDPAGGRLYWVEYFGNRLRRANLDGTGAVDLVTGLGSPHDLELDLPGGKVYWSERGTGLVRRANLDGSGVETVVSAATPFNLALDRVAGEIYFTNPGAGKIQRVATNGSGLVDVLTDLPQVIGLAVDTIAGRIYWSEYRDLTGVLKCANLDGSNVQTVASSLRYPSALVLDSAAGWIYWAEQFAQRIGRARLDGSVVETALSIPGNPEGLALLPSDAAAPTEPTVVSTTHTIGGWGTVPVIGMQWSGASDAGSGLAGYSVQFDHGATAAPDWSVDVVHGADPQTLGSPSLGEGAWYFHLRTCDLAGNCGAALHRGPYGIDSTAPSAPGSLASPSHTVGVASGDPTIEVTWTAATDAASGVNGYAVLFDANPTAACDQVVDQNGAATGATSNPLASGTWYAHVCAVDTAGNWGTVAHAGPYTIDATAPTVASLRPVAGSGSLAEGAALDAGVTQLLVAFSESMATSGGGSAAAVGNYRLFAAGPNQVVDSTGCGSPAVDDLAVTVAGATYLAASQTAALTLDHTTALAASAYRVFACGSLTDAQSNALDGNADTTPGDDFGRGWSVQQTDLLANPNFDLDTTGWTLLGNPGELSWQSADADVAPTSGSAQLVTLVGAGQTHGIDQCLAVTAGEHYRARGLTRIASGTAGQPKVGIRIELFTSASCTGSPSSTVTSPLVSGDTVGGWRLLETTLLAPAGAVSARVRFQADNTVGGPSFTVGFDDLMVNRYVELLFMNGFEAGNTGVWSGTVGGP